jgi:hypothetical protein
VEVLIEAHVFRFRVEVGKGVAKSGGIDHGGDYLGDWLVDV